MRSISLIRVFLLTSIVVLSSLSAFCQNRKDLERKRKHLNQQINVTSNLLSETKKNTTSTYHKFLALEKQISQREELIKTIKAEIELLDQSIDRSAELIASMERDVEKIKVDYGKMMRNAYIMKSTNNRFLFIFNSKSLNEAFTRWKYLQKYDEYRKKQAELIIKTQHSLARKLKKNEESRTSKEDLVNAEMDQQSQLSKELTAKETLLADLKKESSKLSKTLASQKKQRKSLQRKIEAAIARDIAAAEANSSSSSTPFAELEALSGEFQSNKGRLPWPVSTGFISGKFGEQPHPLNSRVLINNTGVDIRTKENSEVRAVFKGEVVSVIYDPAIKNAVMLKHGSYYTVYANIKEIFVSKGDVVQTQESIGLVDSRNGLSELHFEVWKNKIYQKPTYSIARRQFTAQIPTILSSKQELRSPSIISQLILILHHLTAHLMLGAF